eukprot:12431511-Karenia_brevis.AAC.1
MSTFAAAGHASSVLFDAPTEKARRTGKPAEEASALEEFQSSQVGKRSVSQKVGEHSAGRCHCWPCITRDL